MFAACGIGDDELSPGIARVVRRWRFRLPGPDDRRRRAALRAAAAFLRRHANDLPAAGAPRNASERAGLAVRIYRLFLPRGRTGAQGRLAAPSVERVAKAVRALLPS